MNNKDKRGITLIALIVTVTLLIILAGVSIGLITDDNIFNKAEDTVNKTNELMNEQQQMIDEVKDLYR